MQLAMDSQTQTSSLHVIFIPYMAPGHMMPMIDMARLFSAHDGITSTIITTPANAARFQTTIDGDARLGRRIAFHTITLPWADSGLPEGCENLVSAPTPKITINLIHAIDKLQPEFENLLRQSKPDCVVSDVLFPWSVDFAEKMNIPRIAFNGSCFFSECVAECVKKYLPHQEIKSESEEFVVPNLPDNVVLTRSQLPDIVKKKTDFSELFERLKEAEEKSFGMVVNSFYELEPDYANYFRNKLGLRSWHIGPLSLYNTQVDDEGDRAAAIDPHGCLSWLDSMESRSVLYICFGSLVRFSKSQIMEMASALQGSGFPFIWVMGKLLKSEANNQSEEEQWWLPDGFEEKMAANRRGMIIRGWAPQVQILNHSAIRGFLTHCGWNSILEGVCGGVPMITWPVFAEQFYNEKLVTQVLRVGVGVGNMEWRVWATEESSLVEGEKIEKAIKRVMGEGDESAEMRKKAMVLRDMARRAVEEGGSSCMDFRALVQEIRLYSRTPSSLNS